MVITAAQTTAFFSETGQMALPAATQIAIAQEGLETSLTSFSLTREV